MPKKSRRRKQQKPLVPIIQFPSLNGLYSAIREKNDEEFKKLFNERKKLLGDKFNVDEISCPKSPERLNKRTTKITFLAYASLHLNSTLVKFLLENNAKSDKSILLNGKKTTPFQLYLKILADIKSNTQTLNTTEHNHLNLCLLFYINNDKNIASLISPEDKSLALHTICDHLTLFKTPIINHIAQIYTKDPIFKQPSEVKVENGNTAIHQLASIQSAEIIEIFLKSGAEPNIRNKIGHTPLHTAIIHKNLSVIKLLLINEDVDVNAETTMSWETPLIFAVHKDLPTVVTGLIERGADITHSSANNLDALVLSIQEERTDCFKILFTKLTKLESNQEKKYLEENIERLTYRCFCCKTNEIAQYIHEFLSDKRNAAIIQNINFFNIYHALAKNKLHHQLERSIQLYPHHANLTRNNYTLLYETIKFNDATMIKILLDAKANPNKTLNELLDSPLHLAAYKGYHELIDILLDHKNNPANPNVKNKIGETPLQLATKNDHGRSISALLKCDAKQKVYDTDGRAPIHVAIEQNYENAFNALLNVNSLKITTLYSQTLPLLLAATNGRLTMVKKLVEQGAEVDSTDVYGMTPLTYAISSKRHQVIAYLLEQNASLTLQNYLNFNPITLALVEIVSGETLRMIFTHFRNAHHDWIFQSEANRAVNLIAIAEILGFHSNVEIMHEIEQQQIKKEKEQKPSPQIQTKIIPTHTQNSSNSTVISAHHFCKSFFGLTPNEINKSKPLKSKASIKFSPESSQPEVKTSWFSKRLTQSNKNLHQVENDRYTSFVYLDNKAILEQGCSKELLGKFLSQRMIFCKMVIKVLPKIDKDFNIKNNDQILVVGKVKYELKLHGHKDRILLFSVPSDSNPQTRLLLGPIYLKNGLHTESDKKNFLKRKDTIEINLPELEPEKKSPGLSNSYK